MPKGVPLSAAHRRAISEGLKKAHRRKKSRKTQVKDKVQRNVTRAEKLVQQREEKDRTNRNKALRERLMRRLWMV